MGEILAAVGRDGNHILNPDAKSSLQVDAWLHRDDHPGERAPVWLPWEQVPAAPWISTPHAVSSGVTEAALVTGRIDRKNAPRGPPRRRASRTYGGESP